MSQNDMLYNEYKVTVSDIDFSFFTDKGIVVDGKYHSYGHSHSFNEMVYVFKGNARIETDSDTYVLNSGDMAVIHERTFHKITNSKDTYCTFISFGKGKKSGERNKITVYADFGAKGAFDRLINYYYGDYIYKNEFIRTCLFEIITMMLETEKAGKRQDTALDSDNYRRYITENYMNNSYNKSPNLRELSQLLHLSPVHTGRIIKSIYGHCFTEHIANIRIENAKEMLLTTNMTISEIAADTGYKTTHNFYESFKKITSMTPNQYRKQK